MEAKNKLNLKQLWTISTVVLLIMLAFSAWTWTKVPAGTEVPIHWNAAGEADNYGSKFVGIFLLPLVTAGVAGLFTLVLYIDPKRANIRRSATAYRATLIGILLFMLVLHIAAMINVAGYPLNLGYVAAPAIGVLFIIMGNYFGKIRRNYMFGVRTPWTLASELSWNKTHRLAGKLFVAAGLLILLAMFWNPAMALYVMIGSIIITLVLTMGYSYWVWKHDPAIEQNGVVS